MVELTPDLRRRFNDFRVVYLATERRLIEEEVQGAVIAVKVWEEAQAAVPLTAAELLLYRKLVAMHSVNGGTLFASE
jgi:hypothetical protein